MPNGHRKTGSYGGARRPRTILLVDDDGVDLRFYRMVLEHEGYKVETSDSFTAGARRLEGESFDMIVVGQGGDAFEGRVVVERAMQIDSRRPVAVIARCPEPRCYVEAMNLGAVDYRGKTADASEIVSVIEAHLGPASDSTPGRGQSNLTGSRRGASAWTNASPTR